MKTADASAVKIRELFALDVTRNIPPVVYFHEQTPEKLAGEVAEYIITGGYPEGDPRARRVKNGIHEQLVSLLGAIARELGRGGGAELPASWISGFYGSGKSSFAKLLGLALDGVVLPDGTPLATALIRRDDAPRAKELAEAWEALRSKIDPIAVVFDIGAVARDDEHIHSAVLRKLQARLGYCPRSNLVAEHELKLEQDGQWPAFLKAARATLGRHWDDAKQDEQADDHFSHVLHVIDPKRYVEPTSWIDSRAGARHGGGTSVEEVVRSIAVMLERRAAGKHLFVVVDEVSQYVHQDDNRMLKLQSLVSDLGQKLRGRVWLLATGQQKLEDGADATGIGKLKDRFPPALRVHLATTNIRDVVHKRLLKKHPQREALLRSLFAAHRPDLKLYAYECEEITEDDFIEVYPLLPGHVDLLLRITTSLRTRSSRVQGDDHAIRGLLQLMGELFREQRFGDDPVGTLVTLDRIFDVQQTALDPDIQTTLTRIFEHPEVRDDALARRAAKAVALLELIQEEVPTHPPLVARCLYARLGEGDRAPAVSAALEKLRTANLLGYSEKYGYKIQSSAGQEWSKERDNHGVPSEEVSELVRKSLKDFLGSPEQPRMKGRDCAPERSIALSADVIARLDKDGPLAEDLSLAIRRELESISYLGPLRRKPERDYPWNKTKPGDVGSDGRAAIDALLASALLKGEEQNVVVEGVSKWLKRMKVAENLEVRQQGRSNRYELVIHRDGVACNLRDVGIGVSQVLPVLVVAYFAPRGSTIILEEPEIHLHPLAQSVLAELFVEVSRQRGVQFIVETHSEHLFRRMQTLVARQKVSTDDVALYFVERKGKSAHLRTLALDDFGRLPDWPPGFFGDALGETREQARLMFERQQKSAP